MKPKSIAFIMILLIIVSTLNLTVFAPQLVAEDTVTKASNETFAEASKTNQANSTYNVVKSDQVTEDSSKQGAEGATVTQNKPLEDSRQTSRDLGDKWNLWNFNDTSEWSKSAYVDGNKTRLIVGVNGEKHTSFPELEKIAAKQQAKIVNTVSIRGEVSAVVVELPLTSVRGFVEETRASELASYIEPNMKVQACFVPNDPYWPQQWGPQKIEADWAWNTTVGNHDIIVAVVDSGIDYTHPDLAANFVALGYDWVNNDNDPMDDHGHGTHCAGIIAAVLNNSVGIAGLAQVQVMAEKVLDSGGWGYDDWVANGIINATDCGANIISMSLGGYGESELLHQAVKYAYNAGVLVIAAAGNDNTNMKFYPAGYDEVIAVAATEEYDNKWWRSNWGDWIELAAPGVNIYSTVPWGYESWSGTSMACPHVAGAAALVWSLYPNKTRDWVRLWLRYTADDLGDEGFDVYYGYGRVNARKAVEQTSPIHELIAYEWTTPPYIEPGALGIINATILNFGESNETSVSVHLLANGTLVDSTSIGFLASGNSTNISLAWTPTVEGLYNVTLYVVPLPGETSLENNVVWKYIYVGFPVKAVVLHSAGNIVGDIITNWQVLSSEWYLFGDTMVYIDYATLNKDNISYEDIAATKADVLIISCAYDPSMGWHFTDSEIEAITQYVHEGHGLIATAATFYYSVPNNNKLAPLFGLNETTMWTATGTDLLHLLNTTHPIFTDVPNPLVFPQVATVIPQDGRWDSNELVGGKYLALGHYQESAIVTFRGLVYISPWLEIIPAYYHHHLQLLYNAITWSRYQKPEHELIVSLDAPKYLQPGESALLNATVSNMGLNNETNVELFLIIDNTVVNSTTVLKLPVGASYRISYLWAPSVEKMYNITACSPPLPSEELTFNNVDSVIVFVRFVRFVVLWDDTKNTDGDSLTGNYLYLYQLLTASGFTIDELTTGPINSGLLANYDILVLMDPELDFSPSEIADIQNWVATGGALISIPDAGYPSTINTLMAPYGVQMTGWAGGYGTTTNIVSHPITQGVNRIWVDLVQEISVTSPSTTLAWTAEFLAFLSATEGGEVVVVSDSNIMDNNNLGNDDNTQLMLNMFNYMGIPYKHDVAIASVVPSTNEVLAGDTVDIAVVAENQGNDTESFSITAYASSLNSTSGYYKHSLVPTVAPKTQVSVVPSQLTVGNPNVPLPTPPFTINITVQDVEDLYSWQIVLYYNSTILNTRPDLIIIPTENIFKGKYFLSLVPYIENDTKGTYIIFMATLVGKVPGVTGSGVLCQINFTGQAPGTSELNLGTTTEHGYYTRLLNSNLEQIPISIVDGSVTVLGPGLYKIGTKTVTELPPGERITLTLTWNTTGVIPRDYMIWAEASVVPGEIDTTDNGYTDGIIKITKPPFIRDIAVINVTPSTDRTYIGHTININVTILNEGEVPETFDVILYYNITATDIIGTQMVIDLLAGEYRTLTFLWNTNGAKPCHNYTITAYALPVLGETDIADNTLSSPTPVKVKLLGDINGDDKVDIRDIAMAAKAFGSYPGHPRWNPEADLNQDGKIDIRDLATIAKNFGKTYL